MERTSKINTATVAYAVLGLAGATFLHGSLGAFFVLIWFAPTSLLAIFILAAPVGDLNETTKLLASLMGLAVNTLIVRQALRLFFEARDHRRLHRTSGDASCN